MQKKITKSMQDAFCSCYAVLGNASEAAVRAGFNSESALEDGISCLCNDSCREKIRSYRDALSDGGGVAAGLRRLAFGSCSDAVYLVFADELPPPDKLSRLDLFNVSEIKRDKGGGVEIKLFDRIKALEKLYELENTFSDRDKAAGLIRALSSHGEEGDCLDD